MEKSLQLNVFVSDILKQGKSQGEIYYTTGTHSYNNYYDARRLTVSAGNLTSGLKLNLMEKSLQLNVFVSDILKQGKS
ncbi:hypothetical protein, partial [Chryseobacterium sp. CH1]|uniref:hypothetical protein n=1 Tax=Chryseobacterium sp. CH1 TaxID=713551 RepID=UPI0013E97758